MRKPDPFGETLPALLVPSPQLIDALKSTSAPLGSASVKVATKPLNAAPSVALKSAPAAVSAASATVAVALPAEVWPSPQLIEALNSNTVLNGLASVNVATSPVNEAPSVGATAALVIVSGASATWAELSTRALAPPTSLMTTWTAYTPS